MIQFRMKVSGLSVGKTGGLWARIIKRFQEEAGKRVVNATREILGTDEIYALSETYKIAKPRRSGYVHIPGKPSYEPLIFSGNLWGGIVAEPAPGDMIVLTIDPDHGIDKKDGYDYGEEWEQRTEFLEKGLQAVEDGLADLLIEIVFQEMFA